MRKVIRWRVRFFEKKGRERDVREEMRKGMRRC